MRIFLFVFLSLFLSKGHGAIPPEITLKGYVVSFDKKNVTITNPMKDVVVPRSAISKGQEIKVGRLVRATIKSDFILKGINKRREEASKKRIKGRYKKK